MLDWLNQPVAFESFGLARAISLGPIELRFYALAYIAGILAAWWYVARMLKLPDPPAEPRHIDDLVTWAALGIILGGRIAWLIFYADHAEIAADPLMVFKIWKGGMSFHGGMVGVGVAVILYARAQGLSFLRIWDYIAVAAPIGLLLGRIANFVNGELYGRPTDGSWGIIFPGGGPDARHPSQLYEAALEGLLLLLIMAVLFWTTRARFRPGLLTGVFLFGYGLFRFLVEYVREPDVGVAIIAGLTRGQLLCVPMMLGGLWLAGRALPMQSPSHQIR